MENQNSANTLIHASSLYLRQHAHNPVHWQEWSEDILTKAKTEDKLILLSIGYSSCHWCHVMEHEVFEDAESAAIMNSNFICVKVDREERPDIDQLYMDAIQLISGKGGWPLNVIALPDGRPLHGGTYFPKPKWNRMLLDLAHFYQTKKEEAFQFATQLAGGIRRLSVFTADEDMQMETLFSINKVSIEQQKQNFDTQYGGYTWAPKFPLPSHRDLYLQSAEMFQDTTLMEASRLSFSRMAAGGIYDHLGGGFTRYSTDSYWMVPHFEKMLYDNAQLLRSYSQAAVTLNNKSYRDTCFDIHRFIQTEMRSEQGSYYASIDADSEGEEGKFYVWEEEEINQLLKEDAELFCIYYSVRTEGNWEGKNVLHHNLNAAEIAHHFSLSIEEMDSRLSQNRNTLLASRNQRIKPTLDTKVICSWNALMIEAYAKAAALLNEPLFLQEAKLAMDNLLSWAWDGKTLSRIKDKKGSPAFSEDYACTLLALIQLFESGAGTQYLETAQQLMQVCLNEYSDEDQILFGYTAKNKSELLSRKIDVNDDVIPSSNALLAAALYKLSWYYSNPAYLERAQKMCLTIAPRLQKFPHGFTKWMQLLLDMQLGFTQVIISGPESSKWKTEMDAFGKFNLATIILTKESSRLPLLSEKPIQQNETMAWICHDQTCSLPVNNFQDLIKQLKR